MRLIVNPSGVNNLSHLKRLSRCAEEAPPEVEVDSHPLWGWESKEASLIAPLRGAKRD